MADQDQPSRHLQTRATARLGAQLRRRESTDERRSRKTAAAVARLIEFKHQAAARRDRARG